MTSGWVVITVINGEDSDAHRVSPLVDRRGLLQVSRMSVQHTATCRRRHRAGISTGMGKARIKHILQQLRRHGRLGRHRVVVPATRVKRSRRLGSLRRNWGRERLGSRPAAHWHPVFLEPN